MEKRKIYAVDFDNTLSLGATFPNIGRPNTKLIEWLNERQSEGDSIILWTYRKGQTLDRAVEFCKANGLVFDAVNENVPHIIEAFGGDTRKIFANKYIDDQAVTPWEIIDYKPKPKVEKPVREHRKAKIVR